MLGPMTSIVHSFLFSFQSLYHFELENMTGISGGLPPFWLSGTFTGLEAVIIGETGSSICLA